MLPLAVARVGGKVHLLLEPPVVVAPESQDKGARPANDRAGEKGFVESTQIGVPKRAGNPNALWFGMKRRDKHAQTGGNSHERRRSLKNAQGTARTREV